MNKKLGIVIGLSALVLVTLAVGAAASAREPAVEKTEVVFPPVIYADAAAKKTDVAFPITNPELRIHRRYAAERAR